MISLEGSQRTLLLTLRGRADEHARPDGLLRDPLAADWLARLGWDPTFDAVYTPGLQTGFAVRARVMDDVTRAFLAERPTALVIEIGAGLSTRPYRIEAPDARWALVDLPDALAVRATLEAPEPRLLPIPAGFGDSAWIAALPPLDARDVLLIAEGVLLFLDPGEMRRGVDLLRQHLPGATFLLDASGAAFSAAARARWASAGAAVNWLIDGAQDIRALGLHIERQWPTLEQFPERWKGLLRYPLSRAQKQAAVLYETRVLEAS